MCGVLKVGRRLDLGQKPLGSDHGSQLGFQDLERNLALVLQVVSQIDRGHAALTELSLDGVAAFQGCIEADKLDRARGRSGIRPRSTSYTGTGRRKRKPFQSS